MEQILDKVSNDSVDDEELRTKRKRYYRSLLNSTYDYDKKEITKREKRTSSLGSQMRRTDRINEKLKSIKSIDKAKHEFVMEMMEKLKTGSISV